MKYDANAFAAAGLISRDGPSSIMVWFDSGKTAIVIGKTTDGDLDLQPGRSSDHRRLMAALEPSKAMEIEAMGYQPRAFGE